MNTTVDKLSLLLQTKTNLKAALIEQGQSITDDTPFSEYPDFVRSISGKQIQKSGVFGVMWDYSDPSTALTRLTPDNDPSGLVTVTIDSEPVASFNGSTGNSLFDSYMPWAGMQEYNIVNNQVTYKKGDEGFSRTDYDTVVFIPEFWYACINDETNKKRYWYIGSKNEEGLEKHPGSGVYVSRYTLDNAYKSVSGKSSIANITINSGRTKITEKGNGWFLFDFSSLCAIQLLYLVEYADWDSQSKIGIGCKDYDEVLIGLTDYMTFHTGNISINEKTAVQYRSIENPFGVMYYWVDGINLNDDKIYICTEPTKYKSNTDTDYVDTGISVPVISNKYIKSLGYSSTNSWCFVPNSGGGSNSTYIPDGVYVGYSGWHSLYFGYINEITFTGMFSFIGDYNDTSTSKNISVRSKFSPSNESL